MENKDKIILIRFAFEFMKMFGVFYFATKICKFELKEPWKKMYNNGK